MEFSQNGFATIAALDLDPIKVKLMHEESGEGWTRSKADAVEFEYRRFLYLMKNYPNEQAAPRFDVDIFWHYHILDTMKYAQDCQAVFGYFLHHFPYIGLRDEDDVATHHRVGERMQVLYEETFGEQYVRDAATKANGGNAFPLATAFSMATAPASSTPAFSMAIAPASAVNAHGGTAFSMVPTGAAFPLELQPRGFSVRPTLPALAD